MTRDAIGRRLLPALLCSLCLICAISIKPVQDWINAHSKSDTDPDLLYFSAPSAVKKMALGYDGLMADIYWMRAIQYYGQREQAEKRVVRYKNLSKLLEITTTLDPYFLDAYRMGAIFLAEADPVGAGQPRESLKLLD